VAAHPNTSGKASPERATESQTFRSVVAVIVWWLWILFALGNLIDLAVQGRDHLALVAAAVLVAITGVVYVTAFRPRVIATEEGIEVLNPLRDHRVPWSMVEEIDLASLLRVHCRTPGSEAQGESSGRKTKKISAWAVPYSRRRQMTSEMRGRRRLGQAARDAGDRPFGVPDPGYRVRPGGPAESSSEADAVRIVRLLNDRAAAIGQARPPAEGQHATGARLVSNWNWSAIAAVGVPALILLIVVLV
jgi:hypothetical protein